ncbi:MAG: DUF1848 domain-containing protein [Treponema sp.]|nr:DUF1848 domain-containing protein [Treponema sp.]
MILNISGRTDIVQYFSDWMFNRFRKGEVYVRNPMFQNKITHYELNPQKVDCIVFCSKNYAPSLGRLNEITDRFPSYFHYTITAYGKDIEPGVPSIDESIDTLLRLERLVGAKRIAWRYDPVILTKKYTVQQHLITFEHMAARLSGHIDRCIFSFVELYKKLEYNMPELILFTEEDMDALAEGFGRIAAKYRIRIQTCACQADYARYGIHSSGCVTLPILAQATGLSFKDLKHSGMRNSCRCMAYNDIGRYDTCINGCRYCYANQNAELARQNYALYDADAPMLIDSMQEGDIVSHSKQVSFLKDGSSQLTLPF